MKMLKKTVVTLLFLAVAQPAHGIIKIEDPSGQFKEKIEAAINSVSATPTGAILLNIIETHEMIIKVIKSSNKKMQYRDSKNMLLTTTSLLKQLNDWQLAHILAHEFEHAYQDFLDFSYEKALFPIRELSAFSVEARIWVEMGSPIDIDPNDIEEARFWLFDMWTWLDYPWTAMFGWIIRNQSMEFNYETRNWSAKLKKYWNRILNDEIIWRSEWKVHFPQRKNTAVVATKYLQKMVKFGAKNRGLKIRGKVSLWMPRILEDLAKLYDGEEIELRRKPSPSDLFIFRVIPYEIEIYRKEGSWFFRKSISHDLFGQPRRDMEVIEGVGEYTHRY